MNDAQFVDMVQAQQNFEDHLACEKLVSFIVLLHVLEKFLTSD